MKLKIEKIENIIETKSWFIGQINKIDNKRIDKIRKKTKLPTSEMKQDVTIHPDDIQSIVRNSYKQPCKIYIGNLDKQFNFPKETQTTTSHSYEIENLYSSVTMKKIYNLNSPQKEISMLRWFH